MESDTQQEIPDILYTYKKINNNTYHQILNGYLWASPPTEFNDTFDCALNYKIIPLFFRNFEHGVNYDMKGDEMQKMIDNFLSKQRIICFTDNLYNPTMWAHYADNYSGICIEWNVNDIKKNIYKVKYLENVYKMINKYASNTKIQPSDDPTHLILDRIAILKLKTWSYENEFRYIDIVNEHFNHQVPCTITSITFGLKTDENEKDIISYLASTGKNAKLKIKLYQLTQDKKRLTLNKEPFSASHP